MNFKTFSFFLFAAFLLSLPASAQNAKPPREVGLQFSSLDLNGGGFSAFYKKSKKENVYRRIRFFSGTLSAGSVSEEFNFLLAAGIAIGREKRTALDSKLQFYHGPEFAVEASISAISESDAHVFIRPGFGWVLGLQHSFNDRWAVNLETIPRASLTIDAFADGNGVDVFQFNAGISNAVSLGLVRKF